MRRFPSGVGWGDMTSYLLVSAFIWPTSVLFMNSWYRHCCTINKQIGGDTLRLCKYPVSPPTSPLIAASTGALVTITVPSAWGRYSITLLPGTLINWNSSLKSRPFSSVMYAVISVRTNSWMLILLCGLCSDTAVYLVAPVPALAVGSSFRLASVVF